MRLSRGGREKRLARAAVVLYRRHLVSRVSSAYCPPGESMSESRTWKQTLGARIPEAWGREIDIFETQIELRKQRQDRGEAVRRDAAAARRLRPALRQRPAPRRREDAGARVPVGRAHQGPEHDVGRARHAADQDPVRAADRRPAGRAGRRAPRSTPTASCTSPPARTSSSTSSTSRTRPTCMRRLAAVGITTREACGNTVRNVTACPHAGVCRDGGVRRHALRARADVLPARPPRHAGLRAQVQDRVLGLQATTRAA